MSTGKPKGRVRMGTWGMFCLAPAPDFFPVPAFREKPASRGDYLPVSPLYPALLGIRPNCGRGVGCRYDLHGILRFNSRHLVSSNIHHETNVRVRSECPSGHE